MRINYLVHELSLRDFSIYAHNQNMAKIRYPIYAPLGIYLDGVKIDIFHSQSLFAKSNLVNDSFSPNNNTLNIGSLQDLLPPLKQMDIKYSLRKTTLSQLGMLVHLTLPCLSLYKASHDGLFQTIQKFFKVHYLFSQIIVGRSIYIGTIKI